MGKKKRGRPKKSVQKRAKAGGKAAAKKARGKSTRRKSTRTSQKPKKPRKAAGPSQKKKLSEKDRQTLRRHYLEKIESTTREEVERAADATDTKAMTLARSAVEKTKMLGRQALLLSRMIKDSFKGEFQTPWVTIAAAGAALLYLVNPWDLIPDFIPVVGYLDDALVMSFCIEFIRDDLRAYCRAKSVDPRLYGL